jgi:hypothetical protein
MGVPWRIHINQMPKKKKKKLYFLEATEMVEMGY